MWHSENWERPTQGKWRGAMGGIVHPSEFVVKAIGDIDYGTLFTYMFRRFGVPSMGSDDYKEIANWYITTPNKDVVLIVSPRPSGIKHSFGYYINEEKLGDKDSKDIKTALKKAMRDLLVPTYVRDVSINAAGIVEDGIKTVPYFKWAGYGVDHKYFEITYKEG